jgi:hypothetical protein
MKTNRKHLAEFKKVFEEYALALGLSEWEIYWEHEDKEGANAWTRFGGLDDRMAVIGLSKTIDSDLRALAKHEAIEMLVCRFNRMAESRYCTEQQIDDERHFLVRTIEQLIP